MVRVATFLAFSALALHASIVGALEDGFYIIFSNDGERALGFRPAPQTYPPPDLLIELLWPEPYYIVEWHVTKTGPDTYLISDDPRHSDYKLADIDNNVVASAQKLPEEWELSPVGNNRYEIKRPYEDKVVTVRKEDSYPPVVVRPANGSPEQQFYFHRIYREYDNYRWKGSRNRMCVQKKW